MRIVKCHVFLLCIVVNYIFLGIVSFQAFADNSLNSLESSSSLRDGNNCQLWPEIVKNMPVGSAAFKLSSGEEIIFQYRLADTDERRQHGFQRTCPATIAATQILFKFVFAGKPAFHMNNVVAPLDIAFIDEMGKITDIFLMKTYSLLDLKKNLYSPSKPVLYALETRAGYFADLGIKVGDHLHIKH